MKNYFLFPVLLFVLFLLQSCSNQNKVAFGNRKFYPDPRPQLSKSRSETSKQNIGLEKARLVLAAEAPASDISIENQSVKPFSEIAKMAKRPDQTFRSPGKSIRTLRILGRQLIARSHANVSVDSTTDDRKTPGGAVAGFVLGLLSLFVAGVILGILAIIFSAVALSKDSSEYKKGLAVAGLILGIVGLVGALIFIASL